MTMFEDTFIIVSVIEDITEARQFLITVDLPAPPNKRL